MLTILYYSKFGGVGIQITICGKNPTKKQLEGE